MKKCFVALFGILAICATMVYIDAVDAGCGRAARVANRRAARHSVACGASVTTTTTVTRTFQSGPVQGCQSCAPAKAPEPIPAPKQKK